MKRLTREQVKEAARNIRPSRIRDVDAGSYVISEGMKKEKIVALAHLGKAISDCLKAGIDKDTIIGGVGVVLHTVLHEVKPRKKRN